ncbi:MAG: hypothetical protein HY925_04735 [Elusimicrobia bacterium]|nr:hypothetical protein [Elusimicrobiota bacterium]
MTTEVPVASGTFSVDRERAVRMLRGYQLEDPRAFLLPWLRFAQASGASSAKLHTMLGGLSVSFDGRPIGPARLADPFECFFGEEDRAPDLVAGLLGALRLRPARLTLTSEAARLTIDRWERQTLDTDPRPEAGTTLDVAWRWWSARRLTRECVDRVRLARADFSIPISINGRPY